MHGNENVPIRSLGSGSVLKRRRNNKSNAPDASELVRRRNNDLIIDGYNLMHVTRFKPRGTSDGELKRCREGMLALLATQLSAEQYGRITVVFDSDRAPRHLPARIRWRHLDVVFARDENSADDLIVRLVRGSTNPKQLIVVSSDHRVQVATQRRRATAVDSDRWFDALVHDVDEPDSTSEDEPQLSFSSDELDAFRAAMSEPLEATPSDDASEHENPFPQGYFDDLDAE